MGRKRGSANSKRSRPEPSRRQKKEEKRSFSLRDRVLRVMNVTTEPGQDIGNKMCARFGQVTLRVHRSSQQI